MISKEQLMLSDYVSWDGEIVQIVELRQDWCIVSKDYERPQIQYAEVKYEELEPVVLTGDRPRLWIARDIDKKLHIFFGTNKPQKSNGAWYGNFFHHCNLIGEVPNGLRKYQLYHDLEDIPDAIFKNVKWEDEEPTELITI